jgi:hypothetical protein
MGKREVEKPPIMDEGAAQLSKAQLEKRDQERRLSRVQAQIEAMRRSGPTKPKSD